MPQADAPLIEDDAPPPPISLTLVTGSKHEIELYSLILLSVNLSHRVMRRQRDWSIELAESILPQAQHHLNAFVEENRNWPPPAREFVGPPGQSSHGGWVIALLIGLVGFYGQTGPWLPDAVWFERGAMIGRRVLGGNEPWRAITALTLHADLSHLLGNVALGGVVLAFLASQTGGGGAWFLALTTGALANYGNALTHDGGHRFVGFSTAVFGVIGCLCGLKLLTVRQARSILLPLGAGLGLLAMLGTEGEKTDVGAHIWGLGIGILGGLLWHWPLSRRLFSSDLAQAGLGSGSLLMVLAAWWLAFRQ